MFTEYNIPDIDGVFSCHYTNEGIIQLIKYTNRDIDNFYIEELSKIINESTPEYIIKLLRFWSDTECPDKLEIVIIDTDSPKVPLTHTCFSQLELPNYKDNKALVEYNLKYKLDKAIEYGQSYTMAGGFQTNNIMSRILTSYKYYEKYKKYKNKYLSAK